jgi:hypothetical protein
VLSVLIAAILYLKPWGFLRQKLSAKRVSSNSRFSKHGLVSNDRFPWMPRIEVDMYPLFLSFSVAGNEKLCLNGNEIWGSLLRKRYFPFNFFKKNFMKIDV